MFVQVVVEMILTALVEMNTVAPFQLPKEYVMERAMTVWVAKNEKVEHYWLVKKTNMKEISILGSEQKANLKKVLEYVERYNKSDEDVQVAQACADLEELLKEEDSEYALPGFDETISALDKLTIIKK